MKHAALLRRLPLMEGSLIDRDAESVAAGWLPEGDERLLPVIARPQLGQELEELVAFSRSEGLLLVPLGSGSACCAPGLPADDRPALLVQPGHAALWQGVEEDDGTAWIPAGWTIAEAEAALRRIDFSLVPWAEDAGTFGGNWMAPRGSFLVREFRHSAARRLGCEALLPGYGWMRTRGAPRSAAGPGLARGLHGLGGMTALVTQVHVAVRRAAETWAGQVEWGAKEAAGGLETVRRLVAEDMGPTSISLRRSGKGWTLVWRQRLANAWADRVVEEAMRRLDLATFTDDAETATAPAWGRLTPWSALAGRLADKAATHFFGALPDGVYERLDRPATAPERWLRAAAGRDARGVLPRGGTS